MNSLPITLPCWLLLLRLIIILDVVPIRAIFSSLFFFHISATLSVVGGLVSRPNNAPGGKCSARHVVPVLPVRPGPQNGLVVGRILIYSEVSTRPKARPTNMSLPKPFSLRKRKEKKRKMEHELAKRKPRNFCNEFRPIHARG